MLITPLYFSQRSVNTDTVWGVPRRTVNESSGKDGQIQIASVNRLTVIKITLPPFDQSEPALLLSFVLYIFYWKDTRDFPRKAGIQSAYKLSRKTWISSLCYHFPERRKLCLPWCKNLWHLSIVFPFDITCIIRYNRARFCLRLASGSDFGASRRLGNSWIFPFATSWSGALYFRSEKIKQFISNQIKIKFLFLPAGKKKNSIWFWAAVLCFFDRSFLSLESFTESRTEDDPGNSWFACKSQLVLYITT